MNIGNFNCSYSSVDFLKPFVHPHLNAESFADQRHLVGAIFGSQEFLSLFLLAASRAAKVDMFVGRAGRGRGGGGRGRGLVEAVSCAHLHYDSISAKAGR